MINLLKNKKFYIFISIFLFSIIATVFCFYFVKDKLTLKNEMLNIQENYLKTYSTKKFIKTSLKNVELFNKNSMKNYLLNNFDNFLKTNNDLQSSIINYVDLYKSSFTELAELKKMDGINLKNYKEIRKLLNSFSYQKILDILKYMNIKNNSNNVIAQKYFFEGIINELNFNIREANYFYLKSVNLNSFEAKYYNNLGNSYYRLYEFNNSIESFKNGLNISNFNTKQHRNRELKLLYNLAKAYGVTNNYDNAFKAYSNLLVNALNLNNYEYEWLSVYNMALIESIYGNYNIAIDYLKYALKLSHKIKNNDYIAKSLNALSTIQYKYGDYENGKMNGLKAIKYSKKILNLNLMADSSYRVCLNYEYLGKIDLAVFYCNKSIKINDIAGKVLNRPKYYENNGTIYNFVGSIRNYRKSLDYFTEAYNISKKYDLLLDEAFSLNGMADNETMLNNFNKSINYLDSSKNIENNLNIYSCKDCSYATFMWRQNELNKAIKYFKKILNDATKTNNNLAISSAASSLATIYYDIGDYNKALKYSTIALDIDRKIYIYDHHYIRYQEAWQEKILNKINNK